MKMVSLETQKPLIFMILLQFLYAGTTLFSRASLMQGMSPRVFVAYRQALAFLLISPLAFLRSRKEGSSSSSLTLRSFSLIFLISLVGVTVNQNIYFQGLYMASSSMASAMGNILPAVTFTMAYMFGLEKINIRSVRSIAKIIGTIVCVTGAVSMVLFKGPKLLNSSREGETWLLGCILLFASNFCWSAWLLLQVPVSKCYPDHVSLTAWLCFLAATQSAVLAFFLETDLDAWKIQSGLELGSLAFAGAGSAVSFFSQSWVISKRGPLFSALFNPLCTVIVTCFASTLAHEEMYMGSLIGAIAVIFGLYVVLWGKAKDHILEADAEEKRMSTQKTLTDKIIDKTICVVDLEEPLLSKQNIPSVPV